MLIDEIDRNKQIVQQAFTNGLNKNVVKPFNKGILKTSFGNSCMFDTMRYLNKIIIYTLQHYVLIKVILVLN